MIAVVILAVVTTVGAHLGNTVRRRRQRTLSCAATERCQPGLVAAAPALPVIRPKEEAPRP
jgi:hypothetical protein